jgi:uncharacterized protein (TIGR02217 family)
MAVNEFLETPRFPEQISYGSGGGPMFKTQVFEGHSGIEQRGQEWETPRGQYDCAKGITDSDDMAVVKAFFLNCAGRAVGFRFKDWADYTLDNENIGTGDGTTDTFRVTKKYVTGSRTFTRRIFKPVSTGFVVRVNGVVVTQGAGATEVSVDFTTGTLEFGASAIPANGHAVTVTGTFDVPVRFDTDHFNPTHDGFDTQTWSSIPLIELKLEDPT